MGRMAAVLRGLLTVVTLVCVAAVVVSAALFYFAGRMPLDAPLARMYRAETDITALANAVEQYRDRTGALPPRGIDGLALATQAVSTEMSYFAEGAPADPWGRPYVYVPAAAYDAADSGALRDADGGFCAPDGYQVYCLGADGLTGAFGDPARRDDITGWEAERPWREAYRALHADYRRSGAPSTEE